MTWEAPYSIVTVYLDDILIFTNSLEEHQCINGYQFHIGSTAKGVSSSYCSHCIIITYIIPSCLIVSASTYHHSSLHILCISLQSSSVTFHFVLLEFLSNLVGPLFTDKSTNLLHFSFNISPYHSYNFQSSASLMLSSYHCHVILLVTWTSLHLHQDLFIIVTMYIFLFLLILFVLVVVVFFLAPFQFLILTQTLITPFHFDVHWCVCISF